MNRIIVLVGAIITLVGSIMLLWGAFLYVEHVYQGIEIYLLYFGWGVSFLGIAIALFGMALEKALPEQQPSQQYPPQP